MIRILTGDCRTILDTLPAGSVQCVVTSPPYFGLRDYGVAGQIGLEATPDAYVAEMVVVFRDVWRVLREDGTCWLNLGDSFASSAKGSGGLNSFQSGNAGSLFGGSRKLNCGLPDKQLLMIPARVALALQADGWWLRSAITWCKPAPVPESVNDRPTSATEQVFLLTKRSSYYYDAAAIAEPTEYQVPSDRKASGAYSEGSGRYDGGRHRSGGFVTGATRNARNWWVIGRSGFSGAHFATMPPELVERCIKAGTKPGDTVLDPFSGAGTTALVADRLNRNAIGIELNPAYAALASNRISDDAGMFAKVAAE